MPGSSKKVIPVRVDEDWLKETFDPLAAQAGMARAPFIVHLMERYVLAAAQGDEGVIREPAWKARAREQGVPLATEGELRAMQFRRLRTPASAHGQKPKGTPPKKGGKR